MSNGLEQFESARSQAAEHYLLDTANITTTKNNLKQTNQLDKKWQNAEGKLVDDLANPNFSGFYVDIEEVKDDVIGLKEDNNES